MCPQVKKIREIYYLCALKKGRVMAKERNSEEFYKDLKIELDNNSNWPDEYLYKFIVPTEKDKIGLLEKIFDNMGAVIKTKKSSKGKYTSVSIHVNMPDPDAVVKKYREVGKKVEGVIAL
jgi:hypothetical protein